MSNLSADAARSYELTGPYDFNDLPVKASTTIYEGSGVSLASGVARVLNVADTTDGFAGFADKRADNGSGADSDINVRVRSRGYVVLSVATASGVGNVNDAVYASDGNTFTLASTGNLQIGKVARWITSTYCLVYFEATALRSI
jgi:hypothetical protein